MARPKQMTQLMGKGHAPGRQLHHGAKEYITIHLRIKVAQVLSRSLHHGMRDSIDTQRGCHLDDNVVNRHATRLTSNPPRTP